MLLPFYKKNCLEAGLDEAGRGCLAGPVYAAAVILPQDYRHHLLKDSKTLTLKQRLEMKEEIEQYALAYSVQSINEKTIDSINILRASIKAMHQCIKKLSIKPEHLIIDGNYFIPYKKMSYKTVVKGDNTYQNIAAASILAKTYRDEKMLVLSKKFPQYQWDQNKGYGTKSHIQAIMEHGFTPYHRKSFIIKSLQLKLPIPLTS